MQDMMVAFRAFGEENRIRILLHLRERSRCVTEITELLQISQSSVSHHLRVLREAGLVECRRRGLWVDYALASGQGNPYARTLLEVLQGWVEAGKIRMPAQP